MHWNLLFGFAACLLFSNLVPFTVATCFLPNGTSHDDPGSAPCSTDPSNPLSNVCCHTKWANPPGGDIKYGSTQDECLPNGLCQNRGKDSTEGQQQPPWTRYYRVYCINEHWNGCLDVCTDGANAGDVGQLTPCDGTSTSEKWCCGSTTDCCFSQNGTQAITISQILGTNSTTSANTSTSASIIQTSTTAPGGSSSTSTHHAGHKKSPGTIAGIVVGSVSGLILLIALGGFIVAILKRRRSEQAPEFEGKGLDKSAHQDGEYPHKVGDEAHELDATIVHEMADGKAWAELDGNSWSELEGNPTHDSEKKSVARLIR